MRTCLVACATGLLLLFARPAAAQPAYEAEGVRAEPGNAVVGSRGLNDLGHVIASQGSGPPSSSFFWDGTNTVGLPGQGNFSQSFASGLNNSNTIVGGIQFGNYSRAALWQQGQLTVLGLGLLAAASNSCAYAISDSGLIAGTADIMGPGGGRHLFTRNSAGTVQDLGLLPTFHHTIEDMNAGGQMVLLDPGMVNGYLYSGGQYTHLRDLSGGTAGAPYAINDNGLIVGMSWPGQQNARAVAWRDGLIVSVLAVPEGTTGSCAFDVNNAGQIVGYYSAADGRRACLWDADGTFYDLASLVSNGPASGLQYARYINDSGQIVADRNFSEAYLLTPVPEPATVTLLALGLSALFCRRRR